MSSLARRTLRTTAAAAGIAALGTGLAGSAVAAPAGPQPAPGPASAPSGLTSAVPLAGLPSSPSEPGLSDLPMLFVFEGPTVNTAGPSAPGPNVDVIANSQRVVGSDTTNQQGSADGDDADRTSSTPPARDGALSALDSAGLFGRIAQDGLVDQRGYDVDTTRGNGSD
jgi:hypothetical protein